MRGEVSDWLVMFLFFSLSTTGKNYVSGLAIPYMYVALRVISARHFSLGRFQTDIMVTQGIFSKKYCRYMCNDRTPSVWLCLRATVWRERCCSVGPPLSVVRLSG